MNTAGGNLVVRRTDLSLETRIGPFHIAATHNAASGSWIYNFEMTYRGDTFVDGTGGVHDLTNVALGEGIPGTIWVRVDDRHLKTKGGLVYGFSPSGRLQGIGWASDPQRRLRFYGSEVQPGLWLTTSAANCRDESQGACDPLFDVTPDGALRIIGISDRAGRTTSYAYDAEGHLATARSALDVEHGWIGMRYEYDTAGRIVAATNSEGERIEYGYTPDGRLATAKEIGEGDPVYSAVMATTAEDGIFSTRITDPMGVVTVFRFDGQRRTHSIALGGAARTSRSAGRGFGRSSRWRPIGRRRS